MDQDGPRAWHPLRGGRGHDDWVCSSCGRGQRTYLQSLHPRYAFLSESQLLSAGNQACATARSGVPASDNTIKVSQDLGISTSAAYEIVVANMNHLGC